MAHDSPAFGQADLSNCEREQIQFPGSIQPHGALLVVDETATTIIQASINAAEALNLRGDPVGQPLARLPGTLGKRIRAHLGEPLHRRSMAVRCTVGEPALEVDVMLHRPNKGGLVVEVEPAGESPDTRNQLETATQAILGASTLKALCEATATLFADFAGYDRTMVYRFDEHGHGEVFSERRKPHLEAFLGNRYPASDIPQMARSLYLQNRVRVLVDVEHQPVPLKPRLSPLTGRDLDMSLCFLRSMSPIHLQYLKNMGVRSTLVVSLVVGGSLWGLVACHNYEPRFLHYEQRALCELVGELVATRVAALESFVQAQSELVVRRLEQKMVEAVGRDGCWQTALFDGSAGLLQSMGATGAALLFDGEIRTMGEVPGSREIRDIGGWLDATNTAPIFATATLGRDNDQFRPCAAIATGLLATPLSGPGNGDYLLWFRPERIHTVTWGGDPTKPVVIGTDPMQLSPRLSFAQWHQVVEGTSDSWKHGERTTGRLIADTVADMVVQFRSVRMLIAQDQLETLARQVHQSTQPLLLADPDGRVILTNESFEQLLRPGHPSLQRLDDLPQFFEEPVSMRRALRDLVDQDRAWRGEILLRGEGGAPQPLVVRAEAVFATLDRKLGFMLHFAIGTGRKLADQARQRFQDGMIDYQFVRSAKLDTNADRALKAMLAPVIENAQLAALEITYGAEAERMSVLLDTVRSSVGRTAELLEDLLWHAGSRPNA